MAIRSTHLWGGPLPQAVDELFTVPSERTWVIRSLWITNIAASSRTVNLFVNGVLAGNTLGRFVVPTDSLLRFDTWWALPGDSILFGNDASAAVDVVVNAFGFNLHGIAAP